jgi:hypothetical protein
MPEEKEASLNVVKPEEDAPIPDDEYLHGTRLTVLTRHVFGVTRQRSLKQLLTSERKTDRSLARQSLELPYPKSQMNSKTSTKSHGMAQHTS